MTDLRETLRLRSLDAYSVLDTLPEEAFDCLTGLAADLFDAPIALVSLVDAERQWFKSHHGVDVETTPRSWSFCTHAIEQAPGSTLVVEDATSDPRFASSPLVTGDPGVRFYAGAVLTNPEGHNLGTLCVLDVKPRPTPTAQALAQLKVLASIVVDELELIRSKRLTDEKQRLLDMAERMSGVGSWRFDLKQGRRHWSDEVYRIHGLTRDDFQPELDAIIALYHEDDRPVLEALITEATRSGQGYEHQLRIRRPDGELRDVTFKAECQKDEQGAVSGFFGVLQDVTEQTRTLHELTRGQARYKLLADNVADVITRIRLDGAGIYSSPSMHRMFGYHPFEVADLRIRDLVYEGDWPKVQSVFDAMAAGAADTTVEHRMKHKNGGLVWVESNLRLIRNENGTPIEVIAVARDIHNRKALEESLAKARDIAEEQARRAEFAESVAGLGHWRYDARTRELIWSPQMYRIYGLDPAQPLDEATLVAMTHPDDVKTTGRLILKALSQGVADEDTITRIVRPTGEPRYVAGKWQVERGPDGEILAAIGTAIDITEQRHAEAQLRQAQADAEAAAAVKSEFLANMSHELRTPLTSIIGFTRLALEQSDLTGATRNYVERVSLAGRALLSSVNDILDFSKLEAGQVTMLPQPTAVAGLVQATLELFMPQAGAKDLDLDFDAGGDADDLLVEIDPDRVRQILLNLVGNAVKFTDRGGVSVRSRYDRATSQISIEVADTGAGIEADQQAILFQRFSQIDGSFTRNHGGTGLGLAICKGLVDAMGGEIGVDSRVGHGSRFWFKIPAPLVTTKRAADGSTIERPAVDVSAISGLRVLIVDDHATNRELARLVLLGLGAEVAEAAGGAEAVALTSEQPFDVVLMDLRMPGLDGFGAMQRIRQEPGPNVAIPILAFTADVDSDVTERLVADGFDGVVAKPLDLEALIEAIARVTAAERAPAPSHGLMSQGDLT